LQYLVKRCHLPVDKYEVGAAITERNPPRRCIHHSGRGVQYAADEYIEILEEYGFTISMSRKGNPYDNAQAESFTKTLKVEEVYVSEYGTFAEVKERIGEFIELIYNQQRLHSALGCVSPVEFEQDIKSAQRHLAISAPTCPGTGGVHFTLLFGSAL